MAAATAKRPMRAAAAKGAARRSKARNAEESEQEASESPSEAELDSDHLDDDEQPASKKRKRMAPPRNSKSKSPKKRTKRSEPEDSDDDGDEIDQELPDGTRIVGKVVEAPKTGRVPPGQISQNTLNFLSDLQKPECNDRAWFRLHEPVYRLAEKEFKDFIEEFTNDLVKADPQIPHLPPKDIVHRIYRDIRFSNDKTPYKTGFSASFSRAGRKGDFAGYHIMIKPGGASLVAGGSWCPDTAKLSLIRRHILHDPPAFRALISAPEFVALFGAPKPHPKGERQNVFGADDQLKTAPKGFDKNHPDIDLLRLRSFAVVRRMPDAEVLAPDFRERLARTVAAIRPLVHRLNEMMAAPPDDGQDD